MIQANQKPQDVHSSVLVEKIASGWTPEHDGWPHELMRRLASQLNATTELVGNSAENHFEFRLSMSDIYLRGLNDVFCLIVGGKHSATSSVRKFAQNATAPGSLPFIFALSDEALANVRQNVPRDHCLIIEREDVKKMLGCDEPKTFFKQLLWQRIPRRRLDPYDYCRPAEGVMFFGRQNELNRFIEEDTTSFALVGPGRIGKTSLLKRYYYEMIRRRDLHSRRRWLISFTDCRDTAPDAIARYLAMSIAPSSKSDKMTADGLLKFLTYLSKDGPLDLILDEVELVCESDAFKALGDAARSGLCRLILCGKEVLLKMALNHQSLLGCRLTLYPLGSLDENAAKALVLKPLQDLGFKIIEPDRLVEHILHLTGHLPYLLQFCCQKLAEIAIEQQSDEIRLEHANLLQWDFVTAQYFVKPLQDLDDPETRLIGMSLVSNGRKEFSVSVVQEVAHNLGVQISADRTLAVCNSLVINNVLMWNGGSYRVANEGLRFFARQGGYLDQALKESVTAIKAQLRK